jgi:hypothetical protein
MYIYICFTWMASQHIYIYMCVCLYVCIYISLFAKYNYNYQVKEDEFGGACSTSGGEEECI